MRETCFACGRPLTSKPRIAVVNGETTRVYVGRDCYRHIERAAPHAYRPPRGGAALRTESKS
jgi:hypothetical protein